MKVSEITAQTVVQYTRMDTGEADIPPNILLSAAASYVRSYTGLSDTEIDEHEDISIAILVLCSDMYDNRQMTVESSNVNRVVQSILDLHCVNFL